MKTALIYSHFGPYHLARYRYLLETSSNSDISFCGIELFKASSIYNWGISADKLAGLNRLNFNGGDSLSMFLPNKMLKIFYLLYSLKLDAVVVNGWGTPSAMIIHVCSWLLRLQVVIVSDSQEIESRRGWREVLKKIIVKSCYAGFVGGTPHRIYLQKLGMSPNNIFDGCDVVDNSHFYDHAAKRDWGKREILTVARLIPEKNLINAATVFLRFIKTRPKEECWAWVIVGYGPMEGSLMQISQKSLGAIRLVGEASYFELPQKYYDSTLYWQPSIKEPWGLVINEAMASGLPILASSECGCSANLINSKNGWTFSADCKEEMFAALTLAANNFDRWQKMGEASRDIIDGWGLHRFASNLKAALHQIKLK